jgi:hypothetical protein
MKMDVEKWWNDADKGKPKYQGKIIFRFYVVRLKSHADCPGMNSGLRCKRSKTSCMKFIHVALKS